MRIKTKIGSWSAAAIFVAMCLAPASAFADSECSVDSDCSADFICEMSTSPCMATPPCDLEPGAECPEPPACEPEEEGRCVPPPPESCDTAADCEDGLVCVTYTYENCSGGAPVACEEAGGGDCPDPEPFECTSETEGLCLPKYLAPCDVAADCGEGFECEAREVCSCSGGGSTVDYADAGMDESGQNNPPGDPGEGSESDVDGGHAEGGEGGTGNDSPMPDDCSCEPGDVKYCDLPQQECDADAECAGELVCIELPGRASSSPDGTCTSTPGGETVCEDDESGADEDPTRYCLPADIERWIGSDIPGYAGSDSQKQGSNDSGGQGSSPDDGERNVVSADVDRGMSILGDDDDSGCGCASTGTSLPGSFAALFFALLGMAGLRRRSS